MLNKIADSAYAVRSGLNQVLFVTSGRFTEEEIFTYNLLRDIIFDKDVVKYTTIVRTKFPSFRKPEKCEEDKEKMIKENRELLEIISSCNGVIHLDNPPVVDIDEEDELRINLKKRKNSRTKLLTHLYSKCRENYEPTNLDELNDRIGSYVEEKNVLRERLKELEEKVKFLSERERKRTEQEMTKLKGRLEEVEKVIAEQTQGFFE